MSYLYQCEWRSVHGLVTARLVVCSCMPGVFLQLDNYNI